ncbi:MAG: M20/M25/M40 family metallo-hydrolase [Deltaproteobacteria bacterium]|nr:M20/M25/M40 family metallo-hydrolase [Deltaproteobacteria bacterium]
MSLTEAPLHYIKNNFSKFCSDLMEHAKIPSIAFPGFPQGPLEISAQWVKAHMQKIGLENVEILRVGDAPPYVYGEWLHSPDAPTVLLYAHHDVQPPGRDSEWLSPPFSPELRDGRLYGRGVVDDKAGGIMHFAAIEAYLKTLGKLPLNIKFIVEGEEETGSAHLSEFLDKYSEYLRCDVMVLTDTANLQIGLPSITYRLRGIIDAILEVRTLDHPVHSGMWGGPVPDALMALNQILYSLHDENGYLAIPEIISNVPQISDKERGQLKKLPFDSEVFRQELGAVSNIQWIGKKDSSIYERLWCQPSLTVIGVDAPSIQGASNQLVDCVRAKISLRIVSGMDPSFCLEKLCQFLERQTPFNCDVKVTPGACGSPWKVLPDGPAFEAAKKALTKGYDKEPVYIGCGGSIPFVEPLVNKFEKVPALLIGLEDPYCNAHGENESLHLGDWKKGMISAVHLYHELSQISIA